MTQGKQFWNLQRLFPDLPTFLDPHTHPHQTFLEKATWDWHPLCASFFSTSLLFPKESRPEPEHRAPEMGAASCLWKWPYWAASTPPHGLSVHVHISFKVTQDFGI
jgi:hypothetical protein